MGNKYPEIYITQERIASRAQCTREWVSKMTTELANEGWLTKEYRYKKSCVYRLSSFLSDYYTRQSLKELLPACGWIPLAIGLLISSCFVKSSHNSKEELLKSSNTTVDYYTTVVYGDLKTKKSERKVKNLVIERIASKLKISDEQKEQLLSYPDSVLLTAEKAMANKKVDDPFRYFLAICKNQLAIQSGLTDGYSHKPLVKKYASDNRSSNDDRKPPMYGKYESTVDEKSRDINASWNKPIEELGEMKIEALSAVTDPFLRKYVSDIFNKCLTNSISKTEAYDNTIAQQRIAKHQAWRERTRDYISSVSNKEQ